MMCDRCHDTGLLVVSIYFPMPVVGYGPLPDYARGVTNIDCDCPPASEEEAA